MARKKRKIDKHYTICVTSDYSPKKTKYYRTRFNIISVCTIGLVLSLLMVGGLTYFLFTQINSMDSQTLALRELVNEQKDTIERLGDEKSDLAATLDIMNNTVALYKLEEDREAKIFAERHMPTLFPIAGSARIVDSVENTEEPVEGPATPTSTDDVTQLITIFLTTEISDVVAAGDGTVKFIGEDETYGYRVEIDHGNGYTTIYLNSGDVKVKVGDEVVRGAIIFVDSEENNYVGFQISYNGEFIEPMDMLAING